MTKVVVMGALQLSMGRAERRRRKERILWRIGVLAGTGTALKRTIPALLGSDLCRVTVVHGRDSDRLQNVVDLDPSIQLTTSEREFASLHNEYDVVFIGSPPFLHLEHLALVAKLALPVICEKPLIVRREELPRLLDFIEEGRSPLMVAHHIRHQPAVTDIVALLRSGQLGSPVGAALQWCFMMNHDAPNAHWKLDPLLGGSSAMFDCGVHAVDLAVLLFGAPVRVGAVAHRIRSEHVYDSVTVTLDYPMFAVSILASQSSIASCNDLRINFSSSVLRAKDILSENSVRSVEVVGGFAARKMIYDSTDLYRIEVENFCRSLEGSADMGTSVVDALMTTRILFAVEDAVRMRRVVDL